MGWNFLLYSVVLPSIMIAKNLDCLAPGAIHKWLAVLLIFSYYVLLLAWSRSWNVTMRQVKFNWYLYPNKWSLKFCWYLDTPFSGLISYEFSRARNGLDILSVNTKLLTFLIHVILSNIWQVKKWLNFWLLNQKIIWRCSIGYKFYWI